MKIILIILGAIIGIIIGVRRFNKKTHTEDVSKLGCWPIVSIILSGTIGAILGVVIYLIFK